MPNTCGRIKVEYDTGFPQCNVERFAGRRRHHVGGSKARAGRRRRKGERRGDGQFVDFSVVIGIDSGHADIGYDGGGGKEVRGRKSSRREVGGALGLMQKKDAAAVEINLRLLKMRALSDPQVERAVCNEEGEDDVAAKDDESQCKRPGQQRSDVLSRNGLLPYNDGHGK
jgi:hypothetical protein